MKRCLLSGLLILFCLAGCQKNTAEKVIRLEPKTLRQIVLSDCYSDCEHRQERKDNPRSSDETQEELLRAYKGYEIADFNPEQAHLLRYRKGKCNEHILFRTYHGKIGVFRENNDALLDVVDVSVSSLRKEDQKRLKDGISVFGKEEQAAFLDDFNS